MHNSFSVCQGFTPYPSAVTASPIKTVQRCTTGFPPPLHTCSDYAAALHVFPQRNLGGFSIELVIFPGKKPETLSELK